MKMSADIIDGKKIAAEIRQRLKEEIAADTHEDLPVLAVVLVGENPASQIYVRNKKKAAEEIGMGCEVVEFAESIGENALLHSLEELNENPHINGIIVQQPLPSQINLQKVLEAILPEKDVDGFNPLSKIEPATPYGIITYLKDNEFDFKGKKVSTNRQDLPENFVLCHNFWTLNLKNSLFSEEEGQQPWTFMGNNIKPIIVDESFDVHDEEDIIRTEKWILREGIKY